MREEFILHSKPFSINSMYYGDGRTKTQAARDWSYKILHQLGSQENQQKLERLRTAFDPEKHDYFLKLVFFYPEATFFNKEGTISSRTQDLSNIEKPLIDLFFDPSLFEKPSPYGCRNLNTNDKYITGLLSFKRSTPENEPLIKVSIALKPRHSIDIDDNV